MGDSARTAQRDSAKLKQFTTSPSASFKKLGMCSLSAIFKSQLIVI